MLAEFGSGMSSMSEASMPFHPAMDEPSNAWPPVNLSSSNAEIGTVTCCSLPRVSVKRKSMNLTSFSCTNFITSATLLDIKRLLVSVYGVRDPGRRRRRPVQRVADELKHDPCRGM